MGHKNIPQRSGVLLRLEPNFPTYVTSLSVSPNCMADVWVQNGSFKRRFQKREMNTKGIIITSVYLIPESEKPVEFYLLCKLLV